MSSANKMSAAEVLAALRELARENGVELTGIIIAPTGERESRTDQAQNEELRRDGLATLSSLQRLILSVLDRQTARKADWIATKLRRRNDGNLRNALAKLVRVGLLTKGTDGYGYRLV